MMEAQYIVTNNFVYEFYYTSDLMETRRMFHKEGIEHVTLFTLPENVEEFPTASNMRPRPSRIFRRVKT